MKLVCVSNFGNRKEYHCELTEELDKLCGLDTEDEDNIFRNYLLDTRDVWDNCFAIRIPGRTTCGVYLDENNIITKCIIDKELCNGNSKKPYYYPISINEFLKKYIGVKVEIEE